MNFSRLYFSREFIGESWQMWIRDRMHPPPSAQKTGGVCGHLWTHRNGPIVSSETSIIRRLYKCK